MRWKLLISGMVTTAGVIGLAISYTAGGFMLSLVAAVTGAIVMRKELDG